MRKTKKTRKHFEPGEIVYEMSTGDPRVIDWFTGRIDHYDEVTNQYIFVIEGEGGEGTSWRFCTFQSPDKLFKTKEELFRACETYCRERAAYWQGKAVEFSELLLEEKK